MTQYQPYDGVERTPGDYLVALVEHTSRNISFYSHPIYHQLVSGEMDLALLRSLTAQIYLYLTRSARDVFDLLLESYRAHDRELLDVYQRLYTEEFGTKDGEGHLDHLARFAGAIGASLADLTTSDMLPQTRQTISAYLDLARRPFPYNAIGLNVAVDVGGQVTHRPIFLGRWSEALKRGYGLDDRAVEFFTEHEREDGAHVVLLRHLIDKYCTTIEAQSQAWDAVNASLEARRLLDDGVYLSLVGPGVPT